MFKSAYIGLENFTEFNRLNNDLKIIQFRDLQFCISVLIKVNLLNMEAD
jgi:hypothetical protein